MHFTSADAAGFPCLGLGVMHLTPDQMGAGILAAWEASIRHLDAAHIYGNEATLGQALTRSSVARKDIFVTTKICISNFAPDRFIPSLDESLDRLKLDHVDLLLLHWLTPSVALEDQLASLKISVESGKTLHAMASKFTGDWLDRTFALTNLPLITNPIELHPYLHQPRLVAASRKYGLALTAYFAMPEGRVPKDPVLTKIGGRYGKSAAKVALRRLLQRDFAVLTRSANQSRIAENTAIFDFALSAQGITGIDDLADVKIRLANFEGLAPV